MNTNALLLFGAVLCSAAHADYVLSDYATVTTDSSATNTIYGIQTFGNTSSTTTVTVPGGYVSFAANKIASDGTEGFTANVGLLHPITPDWAPLNLTGLTGITFEFRNSARITDYLAVSFGSETYTDAIAKAGTVYEVGIKGTANLAAGTAWKPASVDILDFATPTWWTAPAGFPTIADVLLKVKNLQFAPKTKYTADGTQNGTACKACVTPDMTSQTLDIRNITLVGIGGGYPDTNRTGIGCQATDGTPVALDAAFDDTQNDAGGYWFNFSDYDSTGISTDDAKGSSTSSFVITPGDQFNAGYITMTADLNKMIGTKWHPYAGWAAIGTGFKADATGLTGISFHIQASTLDAAIKAINFKVKLEGVADTATHYVALAAPYITSATGRSYCIRPVDLVQPSFVKPAELSAFDASKIKQLAWEAKITDNRSSAITAAKATFLISDVKFYGINFVGVSPRRIATRPLAASYANGTLSLKGYDGIEGIDVISLDGRKVASFAPAARVSLSLSRGTYFLSARKNGTSLVQSFAVVGR